MGLRLFWGEFLNKINDDSDASFLARIADGIHEKACEIYGVAPGLLTVADALGNPLAGALRDSCSLRNPPPAAGVPPTSLQFFAGGQCPGVQYTVSGNWQYRILLQSNPNPPFTPSTYSFGPVPGPLLSVNPLEELPSSLPGTFFLGQQLWYNGVSNPLSISNKPVGGVAGIDFLGGESEILTVNVAPVIPGTDVCGDAPPHYDFPDTTNINFNPPLSVPLNDGSTFDGTIEFNPNVFIFGKLADITFNFDAGGINFNFNPEINFNADFHFGTGGDNPPSLPAPPPPDYTIPPPAAPPEGIDPDDFPDDFEFQPGPGGDSQDTEQERLLWVKVTLNQIPTNARVQDGGTAQDVVYAGWFSFQQNGHYFPREPIHNEFSIFKAPYGATGYAYTLYTGFSGTIEEIRGK